MLVDEMGSLGVKMKGVVKGMLINKVKGRDFRG